MPIAIPMPKVGISVESCIITEWLKQPGDTVSLGDILFTYETDKASLECESPAEGVLLEIFYQTGDEVPVLQNVCAIGQAGEDTSALRPGDVNNAQESPPTTEIQSSNPVEDSRNINNTAEPINSQQIQQNFQRDGCNLSNFTDSKISPRARRLADSHYVDAMYATPTGPYGRVIEQDIRALIQSGEGAYTSAAYAHAQSGIPIASGIGGKVTTADLKPPQASVIQPQNEYEDITFSGIRRAISQGMTHSLSGIPQLTHNHSFNAGDILAYRAKIKSKRDTFDIPDITLGDMIIFAVSKILPEFPDFNAHMTDPYTLRRFRQINIGFACDTPRGLLVPVIKNAGDKSLSEISTEIKRLAVAARDGKLTPDEMSGATFTISNLGAFGVESFTPVINPPQTGILGVCGITERPHTVDNQIKLYPAMALSLTYDHRAIDGAPAARFIATLCKTLENFTLLMAK